MIPCVSYEFYTGVDGGTRIQAADFHRLITRDHSFLRYYTMGRPVPEAHENEWRMACCAIAEEQLSIDAAKSMAQKSLSAALESKGGELQSQSVGSWSKTYRSGGDSAKEAAEVARVSESALAAVARLYLGHTGLLYRGRGCAHGYVSTCGDAL